MRPSATVDELLCQSERLEAAGIEFLSGDAPACGCIRKGGNEPERPIGSRHERSRNKIG
jgi:hypothetical protein